MKFLKKKLGPKKPLIATVVEIVCVGPTQRTWAEDDPEQLKLANQTFLDAALVEYDPDDTTQSAFILDESIREATHPDAIRRRRLQAAAAAQDSDDELSIELPPELSMMADDPVMLEAIIAQRQWERQQRRSRQAMEGEMDSSDEEEDYDFDSEYSSGEEDEEEDDDHSYASAAASSYNEDSEAEEEDDRSVSEPDISDDNGSYRSRSSREEEDARDSASLSSAGETASRISLQMEDDDDSYDSRNNDDQSTLQPQDGHFSDEEMSQQETPIDAGRVRDEHKSSPEEDGYASNHDDDRRSRSQSFSAHAERYHSEDDEHDEHDAYSQSEDDRSRYSRASNSTRNSYRDDLDNHSYRNEDDRSYASSVRSYPESVRSEDDDYSVEDRKPAAINYDDEDDDYSRSNRSRNSYEDDISYSCHDDDASVDKTEFENGDLSTRSRSARYDDDAYLHHREEEEERELETLEEARRNLPDGEQMHPFLLEHYMALKERKEARKRLSQRMGRTVGY